MLNALVIAGTGVLIAFWFGAALVSPLSFVGISLLAVVLAGPIAARTQHARIAVVNSCGAMAIVLAIAVATLNVIYRGVWIYPAALGVLDAAIASLSATALVATVVSMIARRWSARVATWTFRGLLAAILIVWRLLPEGLADYAMERAVIDGVTKPVLIASAIMTAVTVLVWRMPIVRRSI